jgi:uncharacterized membrane protein YdbT with pleckstrin-like domain
MALQPCRECGEMVSTEATSCPKCGAPNPTQSAEAISAGNSEQTVYHAHVHPIVYFWALIFTAVFVVTMVIQGEPLAMRVGFGALALVVWIACWIMARSVDFVVTNRRVMTRAGVLNKNSQETLLEKVETVGIHQDLLGRVLNYGTVTVVGTGGSHDVFRRIARPLKLREIIHEQIDQRI